MVSLTPLVCQGVKSFASSPQIFTLTSFGFQFVPQLVALGVRNDGQRPVLQS